MAPKNLRNLRTLAHFSSSSQKFYTLHVYGPSQQSFSRCGNSRRPMLLGLSPVLSRHSKFTSSKRALHSSNGVSLDKAMLQRARRKEANCKRKPSSYLNQPTLPFIRGVVYYMTVSMLKGFQTRTATELFKDPLALLSSSLSALHNNLVAPYL